MDNAAESVTVIVTRVIKPGSESAFEDVVKAFIPKALAFPGHLGVHMLRPSAGERSYGCPSKELLASIRPGLSKSRTNPRAGQPLSDALASAQAGQAALGSGEERRVSQGAGGFA